MQWTFWWFERRVVPVGSGIWTLDSVAERAVGDVMDALGNGAFRRKDVPGGVDFESFSKGNKTAKSLSTRLYFSRERENTEY